HCRASSPRARQCRRHPRHAVAPGAWPLPRSDARLSSCSWQTRRGWVGSHLSRAAHLLLRTKLVDGVGDLVGQHLDAHQRQTFLLHAELLRRLCRQVEHASRYVRTPVIHLHLDGFAVLEVGHLDLGIERQRAMRRGELMRIEALAAGGETPLVPTAIPGGEPHLPARPRRAGRGAVGLPGRAAGAVAAAPLASVSTFAATLAGAAETCASRVTPGAITAIRLAAESQ